MTRTILQPTPEGHTDANQRSHTGSEIHGHPAACFSSGEFLIMDPYTNPINMDQHSELTISLQVRIVKLDSAELVQS